MARQLFGTDGVRGVAGERPLDPPTVWALGSALGKDLIDRHGPKPVVLVGMDTRESGPWIAETAAAGLRKQGVEVHFAGIITTPGVAYLTRTGGFAAGVMISASHNPYQDNGIKVFGSSGYKLPDEEELLIEQEIARLLQSDAPERSPLQADRSFEPRYIDFLCSTLKTPLDGVHVVLDCGNGAAFSSGPEAFRRAGARITAIHNEPNGRNINLNCGALHVESLVRAVERERADAGVAFDGDADRAILVSRSGKVVNGDSVLLVMARAFQRKGLLRGDQVVATVMSNLGLEFALARSGVSMVRTPVGDKYVLEEMIRRDASLGGEQSGHVIFREFATTGDGILTALHVLGAAREQSATLDQLVSDLEVFPQKLVNVRVKERRKLEDIPAVQSEVAAAEQAFNGSGRILVRFSGTEPLARVMVEGRNAELVEHYSRSIADAIEKALG